MNQDCHERLDSKLEWVKRTIEYGHCEQVQFYIGRTILEVICDIFDWSILMNNTISDEVLYMCLRDNKAKDLALYDAKFRCTIDRFMTDDKLDYKKCHDVLDEWYNHLIRSKKKMDIENICREDFN